MSITNNSSPMMAALREGRSLADAAQEAIDAARIQAAIAARQAPTMPKKEDQ